MRVEGGSQPILDSRCWMLDWKRIDGVFGRCVVRGAWCVREVEVREEAEVRGWNAEISGSDPPGCDFGAAGKVAEGTLPRGGYKKGLQGYGRETEARVVEG